jgi:hypothetical protein
MARRCATPAVRCDMSRSMSSGDTLVSHRSGRACGLPTPKGRLVTSLHHPARSLSRVSHSLKAGAEPPVHSAEVLEVALE